MPDNNKPSFLSSIKLNENAAQKQFVVDSEYDKNLLPGLDQEQVRARNQGIGSELLNGISRAAIKVVPNVISNIAAIADIEDYYNQDAEVGNDISRAIQEVINPAIDEALPIYRENAGKSLDLGSSDWWTTNMTSVLGSGLEFAITGFGVSAAAGKALQLVGATGKIGRAINVVGNAVALNQAEALVSAQQVFKTTKELQIKKGATEQEANQLAADAAAYTININRLNLPLNLTSAKLFTNPAKVTRQLLEEHSRKTILKEMLGEGVQEYGEEVINNIAQNEGERKGRKEEYSVGNTIKDIFSAEGIEAGLLGFLGGVVQTGFTEGGREALGKNKEYHERYKVQQELLAEYDGLRTAITGGKSLPKVIEDSKELSQRINDIYKADISGNDSLANEKRNDLLQYQSLKAFESGTTEKLEELYHGIINDVNTTSDSKIKAQEALQKIKSWESIYENYSQNISKDRVEPMFNNKLEKESLKSKASNLFLNIQKLQGEIALNSTQGIPSKQETQELEKILGEYKITTDALNQNAEDYDTIISEDFNAEEYKKSKSGIVDETPITKEEVKQEPLTKEPTTKEIKPEVIETKEPIIDSKEGINSTETPTMSEEDSKMMTTIFDKLETGEPLTSEEQAFYEAKTKEAEESIKNKESETTEDDSEFDSKMDKPNERLPKGRKQIVNALEKLREAKSSEQQLNAIHTINLNLKLADKDAITKEELAEAKEVENKLIAEGYEVIDYTGQKFNSGMKMIVQASISDDSLEEDQEIISRVAIPQINKDDKMVQPATVIVSVGTKKKTKVEELPIQDTEEIDYNEEVKGGDTLFKTTATVRELLEKDTKKPSNLRWLNFIDNFKGNPKNYMFKVVLSTDTTGLYDSLLDEQEKLETKNSKDIFVKFLLVDSKTKQPILEEGKYLSTSPLVNEIVDQSLTNEGGKTLAISPEHFLRTKGVADWEKGVNSTSWKELWEAEVKAKNEFRQRLLSGEITYIPIDKRSPGKLDNENADYISPAKALFDDINEKKDRAGIPRYFVPTTKNEGNFQIVNSGTEYFGTKPFDFLKNGETRKLRVGNLYAIKDGVFYPLTSNNLTETQAKSIAKAFANLPSANKPELSLNTIGNYVFLTNPEKDYGKNNLYYDSATKNIHYGENGVIEAEQAANSSEFIKFLTNRKRQVDSSKLKDNPKVYTINDEGFIDSKNPITYYEFLFDSDKRASAFTIKMKPLGERQVTNSYFTFEPSKAITGEPIVLEDKSVIKESDKYNNLEISLSGQGKDLEILVKGEKKEFLLSRDISSPKFTLWDVKTKEGTFTTSQTRPTLEQVQNLVNKYLPKDFIDAVEDWVYQRNNGKLETRLERARIAEEKMISLITKNSIDSEEKQNTEEESPFKDISEVNTGTESKPFTDTEYKKISEEVSKSDDDLGLDDLDLDVEAPKFRVLEGTKNYKKEDIAKVTEWYRKAFGETKTLRITKDIVDNKAFGKYYAGLVYLWENAEEGSLYHEAEHKVEEEFLTDEEVAGLNTEIRGIKGNATLRSGKVKPFSKLTDAEAGEYRAEDFRNYMLTGQKAIAGQPVRNTFFRRLYNYIKTFFTGQVTIQQVYEKLAKGGFSGTKRVKVSNNELYRKHGNLDETQTKLVNDTVTGLLFDVLFKNNITPTQLNDSDNRTDLATKAYTHVKAHIANRLKSLRDKNKETGLTDSEREQALIFKEVFTTFDTFILQHKNSINSLINIQLTEQEYKKSEDVLEKDDEDSTEEGETKEQTKGEHIAANEISTITTTSNNTKMLLATLKERNKDGSVKLNSLGEPQIVSFSKMYNFLLRNLAGVGSYSEIYSKLEKLVSIEPSVQSLLDRIVPSSELSQLDKDQFKLHTDLWQDFNKAESRGTLTLIDAKDGRIYQVDANRHNLKGKIKDVWAANLFESPYMNKSGNTSTIDSSVFEITDNAEFLRAVGIEFEGYSDSEINSLTDDKTGIHKDALKYVKETIQKTLDEGLPVNDLFKDAYNSKLNELLDLAAERSNITVELSYANAEGKRIYSLSLNNYFTKLTSALNNSPTWDSLIARYPQFDSVSAEGSVWIDRLYPKDRFGVRGKRADIKNIKFETSTVAGIKINGDDESGVVITKADVDAKFIQELNDLLTTGKSSVPRTADKGKEESAGLVRNNDVLEVSLQSIKDGQDKPFNSKEVRDIFVGDSENPGYFLAELHRIQKFNVDDLGKNIDIYNKKAGDWTYFTDILSQKTKDILSPKEGTNYLNTSIEPTKDILDSVFQDVQDFLELQSVGNSTYDFKSILAQIKELGIEKKGISSDLLKNHSLETIARGFMVNHMIQTIEHIKIFYGDKAFYKDFYKRTSAAAGTKKLCNNDDSFNGWINENRLFDEKEVGSTYKVAVTADEQVKSSLFDEYVNALESKYGRDLAEDILAEYDLNKEKQRKGMTEADAQGLSTIVFQRQMLIKASLWDFNKQEKQYNYEMAYMKVALHNRGTHVLSESKLAEYKAIVAKGNPEGIINVQKAQYFGSQVMDGLNAPTFHKYSLAPMTWRIVEGTNLEDKFLDMLEKNVGYLVFESGVKVGSPVKKDGTKPSFYDEEGNSNLIDESVLQEIPFDYLGIQVELAPKAKEKVVFGSQFRKLFESNLFDNGGHQVPELESYHGEFLGIIKSMVDSEWNKLTEELGVTFKEDGSFDNMDVTKLVDILRKESESKQLADNLIDSLQVVEGKLKYPIDSLVNRNKLESLMLSLVNSRVVRQTMPGDSLVQKANTGFEPKGIRKKAEGNEFLKSYRKDEKTGKTLPMQVRVTLNAQYKELLKVYKTIEGVNEAIDKKLIDKNILTMVGYRIPTQGLNSIEFMEIVGFYSESEGASIVMPSEIVAKSGGDFDIDKLNIFRPSFKTIVDKKAAGYTSHTSYINKGLGTKYSKEEILELLNSDNDSPEAMEVKAMSKSYENVKKDLPKVLEYIDYGKAAKQNRIIEISKTVLEHPYMFEQLITPNTTRDMDTTVDAVRYADWLSQGNKGTQEEWKAERAKNKNSDTKEIMFGYIMQQFRDFLGGKAAVGTDAINITAHVLFQQAGTKIAKFRTSVTGKGETLGNGLTLTGTNSEEKRVVEINLDCNQTDTHYLLGGRTNKNGKLISDIQSQIANLHLDAAKDPKYKDINLTQELLGTAHFLAHLGVAEDTIIYFIKQPIIMELLRQEKKSILDRIGKSEFKGKPEELMVNSIRKNLRLIDKDGNHLPYDKSVINDNQVLLDSLSGKGIDAKLELQILEDFIRYREYGKQLGSFIKAVNYDTTKFKDLAQVNERLDLVKSIKEGGNLLLTGQDYKDIEDKTIVGAFNRTKGTKAMYSPLFVTESEELIKVRKQLINEISPRLGSKLAERLPNMINNDFIGYITQRFGTYEGQPLFTHIKRLFEGENSLAKQLERIKKIVGDNYLTDQLQGIGLNEIVNNITIYTRKLTTDEQNVLTGAYRELANYESSDGKNIEIVQKFMKDLTTFGILQSGLHNSPITFLSLIPNEYYGDITKNAIEEYKKKPVKDFIHTDFMNRFYLRNLNNSAIVPNFPKEMTQRLADKRFLQTDKDGKITVYYKGKLNSAFTGWEFRKNGHRLQDFYLQDNDSYLDLDDSNTINDSPSTPEVINTPEVIETKQLPESTNTNLEANVKSRLDRGDSRTSIELALINTGVKADELKAVLDKLELTKNSDSGLDKRILKESGTISIKFSDKINSIANIIKTNSWEDDGMSFEEITLQNVNNNKKYKVLIVDRDEILEFEAEDVMGQFNPVSRIPDINIDSFYTESKSKQTNQLDLFKSNVLDTVKDADRLNNLLIELRKTYTVSAQKYKESAEGAMNHNMSFEEFKQIIEEKLKTCGGRLV